MEADYHQSGSSHQQKEPENDKNLINGEKPKNSSNRSQKEIILHKMKLGESLDDSLEIVCHPYPNLTHSEKFYPIEIYSTGKKPKNDSNEQPKTRIEALLNPKPTKKSLARNLNSVFNSGSCKPPRSQRGRESSKRGSPSLQPNGAPSEYFTHLISNNQDAGGYSAYPEATYITSYQEDRSQEIEIRTVDFGREWLPQADVGDSEGFSGILDRLEVHRRDQDGISKAVFRSSIKVDEKRDFFEKMSKRDKREFLWRIEMEEERKEHEFQARVNEIVKNGEEDILTSSMAQAVPRTKEGLQQSLRAVDEGGRNQEEPQMACFTALKPRIEDYSKIWVFQEKRCLDQFGGEQDKIPSICNEKKEDEDQRRDQNNHTRKNLMEKRRKLLSRGFSSMKVIRGQHSSKTDEATTAPTTQKQLTHKTDSQVSKGSKSPQTSEEPSKTLQIALKSTLNGKTRNDKICQICWVREATVGISMEKECPHVFCKPCLLNYITYSLKNNICLKIQCPQSGCHKFARLYHIRDFLLKNEPGSQGSRLLSTKIEFSKNLKTRLRLKPDRIMRLKMNSDLQKCKQIDLKRCPHCKIVNCRDSGISNKVKCPACLRSYCWCCQHAFEKPGAGFHYAWFNPFGCPNLRFSAKKGSEALVRNRCFSLIFWVFYAVFSALSIPLSLIMIWWLIYYYLPHCVKKLDFYESSTLTQRVEAIQKEINYLRPKEDLNTESTTKKSKILQNKAGKGLRDDIVAETDRYIIKEINVENNKGACVSDAQESHLKLVYKQVKIQKTKIDLFLKSRKKSTLGQALLILLGFVTFPVTAASLIVIFPFIVIYLLTKIG